MQHFYFYDSKYGHLCCHYNNNKIVYILDEQGMDVYLLEPNRFKYVLESLFGVQQTWRQA